MRGRGTGEDREYGEGAVVGSHWGRDGPTGKIPRQDYPRDRRRLGETVENGCPTRSMGFSQVPHLSRPLLLPAGHYGPGIPYGPPEVSRVESSRAPVTVPIREQVDETPVRPGTTRLSYPPLGVRTRRKVRVHGSWPTLGGGSVPGRHLESYG